MPLLNNRTRTLAAIGGLLVFVSLSFALALRQGEKRELTFDAQRRVNAHGDEFNALAKSSDAKRLFTATEKGEIVVWNLASNKLERKLRQSSAIHLTASLADRSEFVSAGSNHLKPFNALARKWNVETGEFVDLSGVDSDSTPLALATETTTGLIALTNKERKVLVWDARTNKQLADWTVNDVPMAVAVLGRDVYVATAAQQNFDTEEGPKDGAVVKFNVDNPRQGPADFLRVPGRVWTELAASPDYRLLSATYRSAEERKTVVIDPRSKRERGSFKAESSLWLDSGKLMLFEWMDPVEIVQLSATGPAKTIRKFERFESDTPGRAFDLTGQVSNAAGTKAWASYRKGPGLLEFDLATKKIKTLIGGPSGAYSLSVLTEDGKAGEILTGGADGYVRLWKLADLSLIKEYKVATSERFVRDAVLVPGSRRAVIGTMRMDWQTGSSLEARAVSFILLDLETGQQKKLFDAYTERTSIEVVDNKIVFAELGRIKFATLDGVKTEREFVIDQAIMRTAISANNRWLAVVDYSKRLTVFDLTTGQKQTMPISDEDGGPVVITNDGKYVYQIGREGSLTTLDIAAGKTTTGVLDRVREVHSNVDFMTLANDDRWLVIAGNHQDVGIFDRETLGLLFYTRTGGAAWYVENIWIKGDRMIMTTDIGVMYSGVIK